VKSRTQHSGRSASTAPVSQAGHRAGHSGKSTTPTPRSREPGPVRRRRAAGDTGLAAARSSRHLRGAGRGGGASPVGPDQRPSASPGAPHQNLVAGACDRRVQIATRSASRPCVRASTPSTAKIDPAKIDARPEAFASGPARSSSTWTCGARSTGRPPHTVTLDETKKSSPGNARTRPMPSVAPRGSSVADARH
jgi:hypothetical protein